MSYSSAAFLTTFTVHKKCILHGENQFETQTKKNALGISWNKLGWPAIKKQGETQAMYIPSV